MITLIQLHLGPLIMLITLAVIALYAVRAHSLRRRRDRKADLARYWRAFNDPTGSWHGLEWFDDGMLIVGSRKVSFAEVGCPSEAAFRQAAEESLKRKIAWIKSEHDRLEPQIPAEEKRAAIERRDRDFETLGQKLEGFEPFFDLKAFLETI